MEKIIEQGNELEINVESLEEKTVLKNVSKSLEIPVNHSLSSRDLQVLKAGGKLAFVREKTGKA